MPDANTNALRTTFARNLRMIRQAQGLSPEMLAELAERHKTYISSVERCECNITLDTVERLARALSVDPIDLSRESR